MSLGSRIREARIRQQLTQKDVVGEYMTRNMLSKIENGSAVPSVKTLEYLAGSLSLPVSYLMDENPEGSSEPQESPKPQDVRQQICEAGRALYDRGYVAGNDGNISVRVSDREIWVTPSGVSKGYMSPSMMVCVDINGDVVGGSRSPSSEIKMHLRVFQKRPDVMSVVHTHSVFSTVFAVRRKPVNTAYFTEGVVGLGQVPVARFAMPSTDEVPDSIEPHIENGNAVLLANHGVLTWGKSLTDAVFKMETVEHLAQISFYLESCGDGVEIPPETTQELVKLREYYATLTEKGGA